MANPGYVKQILNGLPEEIRRPLQEAFQYVLDNLRVGLRDSETRSENLQLYRFDGTTHATANTEFSIAHGLGEAPTGLMPYLDLTVAGSVMPVLTVTRAADAARIYLSSPSTNVAISVAVEL